MSTTSLPDAPATDADASVAQPPASAPAPVPADPAVRTYRGRTLEELLPKIREELGPDAIVIRQRDGLMGGLGGFFQQRFVEVDATSGEAAASVRPRIDVYDEQPATPESFAQLLADAEEHADPIVTAAAFAPPVGESEPPVGGSATAAGLGRGSGADADPIADGHADRAGGAGEDDSASLLAERLTPRQDPPAAAPEPEPDGIATALRSAGFTEDFAERLTADAEAHELPFTQGDERAAVRRALARRIPTSLPHRAGGLAVAFAGSGSTACADALATAYVRAGRRGHAVATLEQARTRLAGGAPDAVLALDLPPLPRDRPGIDDLAERLQAIDLDEVLIVVPAAADPAELRALRDRLAPLAPTGLALDCGDDPAATLGAAVELACTTRLPLAYVLDQTPNGTRIAPADPAALAERLLP
ncbi:MAG TPA: hypothetical protein VK506_15910 [Conexibacter sp.]|nr:hypothetical protein [Conexibacter sp.]